MSPLCAPAQSPCAVHRRTTYVAAAQLPGAFSMQLAVATHDDVSLLATQFGAPPDPVKVRLPQQTVPVGHWSGPVLPAQSVANVPAEHEAAQLAV